MGDFRKANIYFKCFVLSYRMSACFLSTILKKMQLRNLVLNIDNSSMTSFFCFVDKRASYPFGIISLAHAPVNVTDFSIDSINCVRHFPQA
jgi:hypothetical protein